MRLFDLDDAAQMTVDVFNDYVEPVGISLMCGEVPTIYFEVHKTGTKENDWLASVRFKNSANISVFKCAVYIQDIFKLCRMCKLWLITRDTFSIVVSYAMLHPLYQTQHINFVHDIDTDYDSMLSAANKETYRFLKNHYSNINDEQSTVLEVLRHHMMQFTNRYWSLRSGYDDFSSAYKSYQRDYENIMLEKYGDAYRTARRYKANYGPVDEDGFIILERTTKTTGEKQMHSVVDADITQYKLASEMYDQSVGSIKRFNIDIDRINRSIQESVDNTKPNTSGKPRGRPMGVKNGQGKPKPQK